jgi:Tol biopolymer transport system component
MNNVTNTTAQWELYPEWSPDGRYIVCQTGTGDPEQSTSSIKLIEIATGATRTLGTPGALPFFTR